MKSGDPERALAACAGAAKSRPAPGGPPPTPPASGRGEQGAALPARPGGERRGGALSFPLPRLRRRTPSLPCLRRRTPSLPRLRRRTPSLPCLRRRTPSLPRLRRRTPSLPRLRRRTPSLPRLRRLHSFSSPACGGGREGVRRRAQARQSPAAPECPPPTPPASGRGEQGAALPARPGGEKRSGLPTRPGGEKRGSGALALSRLWRHESPSPLAAALFLLPRLRGRPGGGPAACAGAAKSCRARMPSPDPSRKREGG